MDTGRTSPFAPLNHGLWRFCRRRGQVSRKFNISTRNLTIFYTYRIYMTLQVAEVHAEQVNTRHSRKDWFLSAPIKPIPTRHAVRAFIRSLILIITLVIFQWPVGIVEAAEADRYEFTGSGFGHGIGMSQYGAKGAADSGHGYSAILGHFYQGTTLSSWPLPSEIRIGLVQGASSITISGNGRFDFVIDGGSFASGSGGQVWTASATGSGAYRITAPDGRSWAVGDPTRAVEVRFQEFGTLLQTAGHNYKYGYLELNTHLVNGAHAIRSLIHVYPFDHYLYGLGEMPSSWHSEALKAQVVAARTYTIEKMLRVGGRADCNCNLYSTTRDQVYVGYDKELAPFGDRWRAAVDTTAAQVVLYDGKPIQAYYSSSSGGHTENNENVWGGSPIPYLRGVPDPWDRNVSPYSRWSIPLSSQELESRLNASTSTSVGSLVGLDLVDPRGVSERVIRVIDENRGGVRIRGSTSIKRVSGETLRSVLGFRSTLLSLITSDISGPIHPDGLIVKGSTPDLWLIRDGTRVHIPSSGVFDSLFATNEIIELSDQMLNRYSAVKQGFRDGSLIRTPDGRVWAVSDGARRHIPSHEAFTSLNYSYNNVREVSADEGRLHPVGSPISSISSHPNGTLIKADGPQIYVVEVGAKRHVPSQAVLESRFSGEDIVLISEAELGAYMQGPPVEFRDGTLIRTEDGRVWVIENGLRRHITNHEVFSGLGYSYNVVWSVSSGEAALHAEGPGLISASFHPDGSILKGSTSEIWVVRMGTLLHVPSGAVLDSLIERKELISVHNSQLSQFTFGKIGFRDGSLIRTADGRVWVISNRMKRHILSPEVFSELKYSYSNVREVTDLEASLHVTGPEINATSRHSDGTVISAPDGTRYYLDNGKKRRISSTKVFASRFREQEVVLVGDSETASYDDGVLLGFRDGSVIRTGDGMIWLISGGLRRHVTNLEVMGSLGIVSERVVDVSNSEGQLHMVGNPLA